MQHVGGRARAVVLAMAATAVVAACGARTPLLVDEWCQGDPLPVDPQLPSMYFVLDRSLSMKEGDKWSKIRGVVASVMASVGDRARFGVTVFPGASDVCAVGTEAMPLTRGDTLGASGPVVTQFLAATAGDPAGGTPTAPTLLDLAGRLSGVPNAVAILATDGGPNCNDLITCDFDTCILNVEGLNGCTPNQPPNCCQASARNCLDDVRAEDAVSMLRAAGVPMYVVGIPGSEFYGPVLDAMAIRGGTARPGTPRYYRVDSDQALGATLGDIANQVMKGCTLTLTKRPKFPTGVTVSVRGTSRPRGSAWTLDGTRLTLLGSACTDFDGDPSAVAVADGCIPIPR